MNLTAEQFFSYWSEVCSDRQEELLNYWCDYKRYTASILHRPDSAIKAVARKAGLNVYSEYYSHDAILFKEEDRVPEAPEGLTWVRRIRIAFEHEHTFNKRLYEEVSHLMLTDCDLRVVVSYPGNPVEQKSILSYLLSVISGSDRAEGFSRARSFLFVCGRRDPETERQVRWQGHIFSTSGWEPIGLPLFSEGNESGVTLRRCFREPIPELEAVARDLDCAVTAHLNGDREQAERLIRGTNTATIRNWVESLWGSNSPYVQYRQVPNPKPSLPKEMRVKLRMPSAAEKQMLHERDGYHCRFCGVPLIRAEVRKRMREAYPDALPWGNSNQLQHAAFQALWLQYDHVLPHARGGDNSLENIVITCAPCNFARMNYTLEEVGMLDPREREPVRSSWDGLERFR